MKFCVDCKHCLIDNIEDEFQKEPICGVPASVNVVTGENKYYTCDVRRTWDSHCGYLAKDFEPKILPQPEQAGGVSPSMVLLWAAALLGSGYLAFLVIFHFVRSTS